MNFMKIPPSRPWPPPMEVILSGRLPNFNGMYTQWFSQAGIPFGQSDHPTPSNSHRSWCDLKVFDILSEKMTVRV